MLYVKGTREDVNKMKTGTVIPWNEGVVFRCPCNGRQVYVAAPPHKIKFDEAGLLTIEQSVGSKKHKAQNRAANWCHFYIKAGRGEMCSDAACPGHELTV